MSPSRALKLRQIAVKAVEQYEWPEGSWRRLYRTLKRHWNRYHAIPLRVRVIGRGDDVRFVLEGGGL